MLIRGICYDEKSSFLRGAAGAPALIRQALHSGSMNAFSEDIHDLGDALPAGTDGRAAPRDGQTFKVPQLRNLYTKLSAAVPPFGGSEFTRPPRTRGFGFFHDGFSPDLWQFMEHQDERLDLWKEPHLVAFLLASAAKQSVLLLPAVMLVWDLLVEKRRQAKAAQSAAGPAANRFENGPKAVAARVRQEG